ncbi:hypothetical protein DPMN_159786 [Dreissena polymorpha]|uniref:Uncharacterized protein n=1 Tax=Dreissena polymorpha TaxID=45954 RepID=A0A9D4EPY9_DREPO|nr:hypothetical protein DPMN_159786 [Dreissena polymorpha]
MWNLRNHILRVVGGDQHLEHQGRPPRLLRNVTGKGKQCMEIPLLNSDFGNSVNVVPDKTVKSSCLFVKCGARYDCAVLLLVRKVWCQIRLCSPLALRKVWCQIRLCSPLANVAYFHGIEHRSSRQEEDRLEHTNDLKGARTVDMVTVVTYAKDNNLRVWDRSRDKKRTTDRQAKSSN